MRAGIWFTGACIVLSGICYGAQAEEKEQSEAAQSTADEAAIARSTDVFLDYLNRPEPAQPGDAEKELAGVLLGLKAIETEEDSGKTEQAKALFITRRDEVVALPAEPTSGAEKIATPAELEAEESPAVQLMQIPISTIGMVVGGFFLLALLGLLRMDDELAERFAPWLIRVRRSKDP